MSIQAMVWALKMPLTSPSMKLALVAIGNYADENGVCWPSAKRLSEDSSQSIASVRRRWRELEEIGLLTRFERARDDGRGQCSNELRLHTHLSHEQMKPIIDAWELQREQARKGISAQADDSDDPPYQSAQGVSTAQVFTDDNGPMVTADHPSKNLHLEPIVNPPTPQGGSEPAPCEIPEGEAWPGADVWPSFEQAWGEPILRQTIARQAWSALSPDERSHATLAAKGYQVWRSKQNKPPNLINAHIFLREPDAWVGFAKQAPPPPDSIAGSFVPISTEPGRALMALHLIAGQPNRSFPSGNHKVIRVLKELPPRVLALSSSVEPDGRRDESKWPLIEPGTKPFYAWCEFVRAELGVHPIVSEVIVGRILKDEIDETTGEKTGREILDHLDRRKGFRAPSLWPPRVDGSPSGTDPPDELSDEAARELARN